MPKYSYNGRKNRISGDCVIGLTVDTHGIPQNVHVVTSLEPSLDENAVKAVKRWRYTPAIINGSGAPFESTVKIKFRAPSVAILSKLLPVEGRQFSGPLAPREKLRSSQE